MLYISCSACAKTLLSFCIYEQRLCHVFAVYVIAMHVNRLDKTKNRLIYCILWACRCAKAESCLCSMYVCDVYELQRVRKDVAVVLCILQRMYIDQKIETERFTALHKCVCVQKLSRAFAMTVWVSYISCSVCAKTLLSFCVYEQRLCRVFAIYVIAMHVNWFNKAENRSIYCITQTCIYAKAESCLRNVWVCDVYELQRVRKDVAVVLCMSKDCVMFSQCMYLRRM